MEKHKQVASPSIYNNLAILYAKIGKTSLALKHFKKSIAIREENDREDPVLCDYYHNIAKLYAENKNYTKALKYYYQKVRLLEKLTKQDSKYQSFLISSYDEIISLQIENQDLVSALKYYQKEKRLLKKNLDTNSIIKIVTINQNMISLSLTPDKTEKYYLESIRLLKKDNTKASKPLLAHIYVMLANYYNYLGKYSLAQKYYLKNITLRERQEKEDSCSNSSFLILSYIHLLSLYYKIDDIANAHVIQNKLNNIINREL